MIKLYDKDSYIKEFNAEVVSCEKTADGYRVLLDQTAFFPTAGGQDCDSGTLGGERVLRVEIEDEKVYHILEKPIEVASPVEGKIDWDARFRKMQHHTAEHIVSGLAHTLLGAENVGFHLSDTEVTIDYNIELSSEEVLQLERAANRAVWQNVAVTAVYPAEEELAKIKYRAKLDLTENVRIVTIDGIDTCACCAPHLKSTGEIGVIKLKDVMRHRGGVRMRMICGLDALCDYEEKCESVLKISNLMSARQSEVAEATERIMAELSEQKQKNAALSKSLAMQKAEQLPKTDANICIFENDLDADALRTLANVGKMRCGGVFVVCSGSDEAGYSYIIAAQNQELGDKVREINAALSGRGGGRGDMVQGRFSAKRAEIEKYFEV